MIQSDKKIIRITTVAGSLKVLLKGQLGYINQHFTVIGVTSDGPEIEEVRKNEGIRVETLEMTRTISPLKDIRALIKLYHFLRKEMPFVVHSHTPKAGIVGMTAAWFARVPHRYHTVAGMPLLEATGFKRTLLNIVEKITYKCATKVFPNSFGLEKIILKEKFAAPDKLEVIGNGSSNGIDVTHFSKAHFSEGFQQELKQELGIHKNDLVAVFVGRLVKDKGVNELIAAFQRFLKEESNTKLILVGWRENELDPLKKETEDTLKNVSNIIEVGYQKDVRPYFAIADMLVFPTYREGFPNVVLQAGAMELPSIVTNINGCNEIIVDEHNGLIIPVKNEQAIVDAMLHLSKNNEVRQKMGTNARQNVVSKYQQEYIWEELLNRYNNLE